MTTPQHFLQGFIIVHATTGDIPLAVAAGLLSAEPDLIPLRETIKKQWGLYDAIHVLDWWMLLNPFRAVHLLEDFFTHKHDGDGGWHWWAYPLEVILDAGAAYYLWIHFVR